MSYRCLNCWGNQLKTKGVILLSVQHSLPGVCTICRGYLCKPGKVGKVMKWPLPTNLKELQSFLGWPHTMTSSY